VKITTVFVVFATLVALLWSCGGTTAPVAERMIILGIDGMDPKFLERHWDDLPNLRKLRDQGSFHPLTTTIPPQSPVAWSSVITGMDPGGHGIFDFIHRDPFTRMPFSSMAQTTGAGRTLEIGSYVLPLSSPEVSSHRAGTAFWEHLADHKVPATVIRMPANFPAVETEAVSLSGMGTPDMLGTYGTFTFVTADPEEKTRQAPGGRIVRIETSSEPIRINVEGPVNTFLKSQPASTVELVVHRDPEQAVARLDLGNESVVLKQGEWSGWMRARFPLLGEVMGASGIFRVYLKQVRPHFQLYISPINIDPSAPELPISTPASYSETLAKAVGLFYTQGMAEDTSALREGTLTLEEFLDQSRAVLEETRALFRYELEKFESGLLFFYVSSVDQNAHMLWGKYENELLEYYRATDRMVGEAMEKAGDNTTLIVMSDHGFTNFDRGVHLNRVLMREGFLTLDDPKNTSDQELFPHVDWSRTQAYAMGLNGLYLNRLGREEGGIVAEGEEANDLIADITAKLLAFRDPESGEQVIEEVYEAAKVYQGFELEFAPDLLIGYRPPYRASWQTTLGAVPAQTVVDNKDAWIGDHCVAPQFVPGVLLSNRKITVDDPRLPDLTATIYQYFGLAATEGVIGRPLF
jgi:predicted AlkP superfamily phosphohydrolase/phosphomutase